MHLSLLKFQSNFELQSKQNQIYPSTVWNSLKILFMNVSQSVPLGMIHCVSSTEAFSTFDLIAKISD